MVHSNKIIEAQKSIIYNSVPKDLQINRIPGSGEHAGTGMITFSVRSYSFSVLLQAPKTGEYRLSWPRVLNKVIVRDV